MIETLENKDLNLTTFVCTGSLTPTEIETQLSDFYKGSPTLHTIWDYTGADLAALTAEKIHDLVGFLKNTSHSRAGGRAALVFSMEQLMAINDRMSSLAELELEQGTIKIFDGLEKAQAWVVG